MATTARRSDLSDLRGSLWAGEEAWPRRLWCGLSDESHLWQSPVRAQMSVGDLEVKIYWASQGVMMEGFHYQWHKKNMFLAFFHHPVLVLADFDCHFFVSMYTAASNGFIPMFYTMLVVYFHILDYAVYDIWIYMMYDMLDTCYDVISFFVRKRTYGVSKSKGCLAWKRWRERERDLKIYIT